MVAELVYAYASEAYAARLESSNLSHGTKIRVYTSGMNNLFTPHKLEYWSFVWSEVRLVVAAVALFLGGVPPIILIMPSTAVIGLLKVAWILSGLASAYLLYRWMQNGQHLFGKKETRDMLAFLVMNVSGLNLGLTGLLGSNIGMIISSNTTVFMVVGVLYVISAVYLYSRWGAYGKKLF